MNTKFSEEDIAKINQLKSELKRKFVHTLIGTPVTLQKLIIDNCILTGGSISSVYHDEVVNDWDLYFVNEQSLDLFNSLIGSDEELKNFIADISEKYRGVVGANGKVVTENAVTFKNKLQVITRSTAKESRKTFDFLHCMPYYSFKEEKLYMSLAQYESIKEKTLVVNANEPEIHRYQKYIDRGWKASRVS